MQKIVFFDIDGTLWDSKMQIPTSTYEAMRKLRENGHKAFICSGRSRGNIKAENLMSLGFDGVIAACGNHVEMDGKILHEYIMEGELLKKSIEVLRKYHMPVVLEGPVDHWIDVTGFEEDPYVDFLYEQLGDHAHPLLGYEEGMRINKFSADIIKDTDYDAVKECLCEEFDFLEHEGGIVEFIPKGTSKATGIEWLCRYLGVDISDTYAIGDSVNDLDMLRSVGHGIAMGNGTPVAKEAAEYVTTDIHDNGIYNALKQYNLI